VQRCNINNFILIFQKLYDNLYNIKDEPLNESSKIFDFCANALKLFTSILLNEIKEMPFENKRHFLNKIDILIDCSISLLKNSNKLMNVCCQISWLLIILFNLITN